MNIGWFKFLAKFYVDKLQGCIGPPWHAAEVPDCISPTMGIRDGLPCAATRGSGANTKDCTTEGSCRTSQGRPGHAQNQVEVIWHSPAG